MYKRRNWACVLFVGIMALGVVYMVFATGLGFLMSGWMSATEPGPMAGPFRAMMVVMQVFMVAFCLGLCCVLGRIIKRLTSDETRREFRPSPKEAPLTS